MKSDPINASWNRFKSSNSLIEISQDEILDIIENAEKNSFHFSSGRIFRNAAIFSFLIIFCQNCYL